MNKIYVFFRYLSSILPSRCLHILLRLLASLSTRLGLSNRHDNCSPKEPLPPADTGGFISASRAPVLRRTREYPTLGTASQGFTIEGLELDTSDVSWRLTQSPVQSPTSLFSTTVVSSPLSQTSPSSPKPERALPSLTPTTPLKSRRYAPRDPVTVDVATIPAGPLAVHRGRQRSLPLHWLRYTHPEGLSYFVNDSRNIRIVTEAYIYDEPIRQSVTNFADSVLERAASDGWSLNSPAMELVVDYDEDQKSCSYYFVDDTDESIFWLEEFSTDSEELDMPLVFGHDHLRTHLHEHYWQHKEYFPVHHHNPENADKNLLATLTHSCIDVVTATTSTSSYERSQLETMINVMKNLKNSTGSEGQRNCIVARLWTEIYRTRFINYHGEKYARLFRTQIKVPEEPSSLPLKLVFLLLFDAPSTHLATLQELYPDEVIYSDGWRKFMEAVVEDWKDSILSTTVLLAANMSFLAIFNSKEDVMGASRAVTCSLVSTVCSTASIVIGLLHVRKHRPLTQDHATEGNNYLQSKKHPQLGFRTLAIIYSLPYAFLMWAMVSFIAAILLYTFQSGLDRGSTLVVCAISIGLGCTLIWAIAYFWKDELHLLDDLRGMRRALRKLSSPLRLNRLVSTVTSQSHNPEAANDHILRHWARRFAASTRRNENGNPGGV